MSSQEQYKRERDQLQMFLSEIGDYLAEHSGFVLMNCKRIHYLFTISYVDIQNPYSHFSPMNVRTRAI